MSVFLAEMDTETLNWTAIGATEEEAKKAIFKKWKEREKQNVYMHSFKSIKELDDNYGICVKKFELGECKVL